MPQFTQWNVPSPFPNILYNPAAVDAAIAKTQSELGNLDIERQKFGLEKAKFDRGVTEGEGYIGGSLSGTAGAPGDSTPFERKMGFSEGGGTADKVNSEGYAGQYQFGAARLADLGLYTPAQGEDLKRNEWKGTFKIAPYGVANLQDFLKNPAAQHAAFVAHVADVDKVIDATPGADKFDRNGLRAVAHLGGNGGMQAFVASGGNLNRADSNGTSLKAYYQKFADGGAPALQKAFGAAHGPGGPQSNLPTVQPGRLAGWVDPNAPLPVPPIPPTGGPPPAFNPNAGPRLAGASPAGAPGVEPAVALGALPPAAPVGTDDPMAKVSYPPVVTGQADETVPVEPSRQAMRLGGVAAAGDAAGPGLPDAQPNRMAYGTGLPGVTIGMPGNGLAPPPTTVAPTTAAAPAAAPPGAATRPPPEAPPAAPSRAIQREPLLSNNLTASQQDAARRAIRAGTPLATVQAHVEQWKQENVAARHQDAVDAAAQQQQDYERRRQFQQDTRQSENDKAAAQKAAEDRVQREIENKRAEGAQKLSQAANDREAAKAHEENLNNLTPKIEDGTATPAEKRLYAGSYYALQQQGATATTMDDPNNPGQKIPAMITRRLPNFPEPEGGALPLVMSSPGAPTRPAATKEEGQSATFADRMAAAETVMKPLDTSAITWSQGIREKAGNFLGYNINSTDYQKLRTAQEAFLSAIIRDESGAAVHDDEWKRYAHIYFPMPGDDAEQIKLKQQFRQIAQESEARKAGAGYKPTAAAAAATQPPKAERPPLSSFAR